MSNDSNSPFALAIAQDGEWAELVGRCVEQLNVPPQGALGFVYVTDPLADPLARIVTELRERLAVEHWIGAVGEGIVAGFSELYDRPAMVVMITSYAESDFTLLTQMAGHGEQLAPATDAVRLAILHADPNPGVMSELERLSGTLPDTFVNGGISSSSSGHARQVADQVSTGRLCGVVLEGSIPVLTALTQGCSPIGPRHRITRCERNVAITLDNRPALDVFNDVVGEVLARDPSRAAGFIFAGIPITNSDHGDYLVRNLLGVDRGQKLVAIADHLKEGSELMFCRRDGNTARADMLRMLSNLKERLHGQRPRGGLYVTCLGRGRNQFGDDSEELKMIREQLGEFPLCGFFANGELFNGRLYGYTGVLTLFL